MFLSPLLFVIVIFYYIFYFLIYFYSIIALLNATNYFELYVDNFDSALCIKKGPARVD